MASMSGKGPIALNSLWVGPELGYLEQLCLRSALAAGHSVRLFSYTPRDISGVPEGVDVRDAAEIAPKEDMLFPSGSGFEALASDFWRYRMLGKGLGAWVDMDLIFLRPLDLDDSFIFGWQDSETVNNAVLAAPSDSEFVADLIELPKPNRRPPWFGPKRTLQFWLKRLTQGDIALGDMPWGTYGPELVTYLVRKHRLERFVQAPDVFYPIPWPDAPILYEPADRAAALVTKDTRAIHMWHGRLGELAANPPPVGSFIAQMCERFGVEVRGAS
jgi:hypothetical protein